VARFGQMNRSFTATTLPLVTAAKTMIARARDRFDLHPERLAADTAYGSAEMLDWLANKQNIEPHVPVFDKSQRADEKKMVRPSTHPQKVFHEHDGS